MKKSALISGVWHSILSIIGMMNDTVTVPRTCGASAAYRF